MEQDNLSSYFGNMSVVSAALKEQGVALQELYELSGINILDYQQDRKRIPNSKIERFVEAAILKTSPQLSLACVEHLNPVSYHALGTGLLYSANLRSFGQRFSRYFRLISTLLKVDFDEDSMQPKLVMTAPEHVCTLVKNFDSDTFAAITVKFLRWVYGPQYSPVQVDLIWQPTENKVPQYQEYFNCKINFNAEQTAVYFAVDELDNEFISANANLAREADKTVTELMQKTISIDIESLVYAKIYELLPTGDCSRETVANALGMTPSTLHKKLSLQNSNYKEMHDKICKRLAEQYIGEDNLSFGEAAYLLGISDNSNFSRAFKRWVGMAPTEYRQRNSK